VEGGPSSQWGAKSVAWTEGVADGTGCRAGRPAPGSGRLGLPWSPGDTRNYFRSVALGGFNDVKEVLPTICSDSINVDSASVEQEHTVADVAVLRCPPPTF